MTHITWWNCSANLRNYCSSRYHRVTLAYEVTVDHKRRCLHCSPGFYGSMNDKTIIKFDRFVSGIHSKQIYANIEFDLYDVAGVSSTEKGLYLLSDNGYHPWRCLQYPSKILSNNEVLLYSDWSSRLESIRKDVECFFGILKRRWKILQYGVRTKLMKSVDNLLYACCAFHNMLLEWDELYETVEPNFEDPDLFPEDLNDVNDNQDEALVPPEIPKVDHIDLERKLVAHFSFMKRSGQVNWIR